MGSQASGSALSPPACLAAWATSTRQIDGGPLVARAPPDANTYHPRPPRCALAGARRRPVDMSMKRFSRTLVRIAAPLSLSAAGMGLATPANAQLAAPWDGNPISRAKSSRAAGPLAARATTAAPALANARSATTCCPGFAHRTRHRTYQACTPMAPCGRPGGSSQSDSRSANVRYTERAARVTAPGAGILDSATRSVVCAPLRRSDDVVVAGRDRTS